MQKPAENDTSKIFTVPNLLSLVRIALIPLIVWAYCGRQNSLLTAVLLFVSGATDAADGIIARKCGAVSELGKALDPIADKLTQAAMLLCLVSRFPLMLMPFVLLIVKETAVGLTGFEVIRKTGQVHGAVWHGKVTTVLLYGIMLLHLLWPAIPGNVSDVLIWICTGMMLFSGALYLCKNLYLLKAAKKKKRA